MGRAWVPEAKEVQDATICWQGDDHSILGRKRGYYVGLFTQQKYNKNSAEGVIAPEGAKVRGVTIRMWLLNKFISFLAVLSWKTGLKKM